MSLIFHLLPLIYPIFTCAEYGSRFTKVLNTDQRESWSGSRSGSKTLFRILWYDVWMSTILRGRVEWFTTFLWFFILDTLVWYISMSLIKKSQKIATREHHLTFMFFFKDHLKDLLQNLFRPTIWEKWFLTWTKDISKNFFSVFIFRLNKKFKQNIPSWCRKTFHSLFLFFYFRVSVKKWAEALPLPGPAGPS